MLREQISIGILNNRNIIFKVDKENKSDADFLDFNILCHYTLFQDDGDVIFAGYDISKDYISSVEVTKIDTMARTISGKFNLLFDKSSQSKDKAGIAEKVFFKNGEFKVQY